MVMQDNQQQLLTFRINLIANLPNFDFQRRLEYIDRNRYEVRTVVADELVQRGDQGWTQRLL